MDDSIDQVIQSGEPTNESHWGWGTPISPDPARGSPRLKQDTRSIRSGSGYDVDGKRSIAGSDRGRDISPPSSSNLRQGEWRDDESRSSRGRERGREAAPDFFSSEIFQMVLQNPTTTHRLLKFSQDRSCGENVEFLAKVAAYHRLLDETSKLLGEIHSTYIAADSPKQINLPHHVMKRTTYDFKNVTHATLPTMASIFDGAQDEIEKLISSDIYPRFVKHQMTTASALALTDDKTKYQGLGDCFCMTDPSVADNPIVFASDGFINVTGYNRNEIIPRNCRFLQGSQTDRTLIKRLRMSIDNCEESVELLLNFKKNGEPFWNLLYVAPLLDENGSTSFFLGGQVDCSTTVHSRADIMRVLSLPDDEEPDKPNLSNGRPASTRSKPSSRSTSANAKIRSSFFKTFKLDNGAAVRVEPGFEKELLDKVGNLNFKTQVAAFYSAYSKYIVMHYSQSTGDFIISHYSPGILDMLILTLPNGSRQTLYGREIFKVLAEHIPTTSSSFSSSPLKGFKMTVRENIRKGRAVSVELGLLTGFENSKTHTYGGYGAGSNPGYSANAVGGVTYPKSKRSEEKYFCHWTPLKDLDAKVSWVVLTIVPSNGK